ncbi:hypothetical protein HanPSC8_Chr08g0338211 [Helianthus annuus]|nr:hypothetical protein HanPSC8_Chr08g0338211 [Helianthus annuus]
MPHELNFFFGVMVKVGLVVKRVVWSVGLLSGRRPWKVGADKKVVAMVVVVVCGGGVKNEKNEDYCEIYWLR